jgi:2,3-dihydroxybenzoate---[aryl-carrier protein] ligase
VLNVACVPYPDPVLGERMCACVVLRPGRSLTLDELVSFLRGFEIATFKLPERLELFDTLPLSGFGKVSKRDLAALLREPKGRGPGWTEERGTSDEGRRGLESAPAASEGHE